MELAYDPRRTRKEIDEENVRNIPEDIFYGGNQTRNHGNYVRQHYKLDVDIVASWHLSQILLALL